jgi:hypothetical protein
MDDDAASVEGNEDENPPILTESVDFDSLSLKEKERVPADEIVWLLLMKHVREQW